MPSLAVKECHCAERQMERDRQRDKREQVQSGTKRLLECTPEGTTNICFYLISYQTLIHHSTQYLSRGPKSPTTAILSPISSYCCHSASYMLLLLPS